MKPDHQPSNTGSISSSTASTSEVQQLGEGPVALFLHGGPGAAGAIWAHLAARLPDLTCLLLDRPGTGLSDPHRLSDAAAVRRESETLVADVLDGLGIDKAHVVGSSHGSYVALLSAAARPERIDRSFHLGCPGFVEGMTLTTVDRLVLAPGVSRLFSLFPVTEKGMRKTLRQLGHRTLNVSQPTLDWLVALGNHTDTMRNELASMAAMGSFRSGFDPSLTVGVDTLRTIESPTYFLWGANDVYGGEKVARGVVDSMPDAELEMMPNAGHLCWIDDLDHAAETIRKHLMG